MHSCRQLIYNVARWKTPLPSNLPSLPVTAIVPSARRHYRLQQCRHYSARKGFFSSIVENVREEIAKNKEMKESIKKFREEAEKLENSEALQAARKKFHAVESEASRGSEALRETLEGLRGRVGHALDEAANTDIARKAGKLTEELSKSARGAAETLSDTSQRLGQTSAFRTISQATAAVRSEMAPRGLEGRVYTAPHTLRKRQEVPETDERTIAPDEHTTGLELHRDSRFYQQWQDFKDNNPYINKMLDWKLRLEESDGTIARASRFVTDKVSGLFGGLFEHTDLSKTLTEICKLEPGFSAQQFLQRCSDDIIPNVLEALVRGDLEVLRDWCHEGVYNVLAAPIKQCRELGYRLDSKVLDIEQIELVMGKMMEQGPVLVVTFQAQQIMCVRDARGVVVEGDPDRVMRVNYAWVLCRDPQELNSAAAWRLLEMSASSVEQLI